MIFCIKILNKSLMFKLLFRKKINCSEKYMILICSLAMEQSNSLPPDFLTYKTLLEGVCREGKGDQAFQFLDDFRKRDHMMKENTYKMLLNGLHFVSRE
ncbi:hypothetical protein DCAR_0100276 [Daucus carota subsp. sativus]|uniref:Pentacotripeptide-repeat region of PRORP domain-containing protein n=1 Tax=Daucus carota subsp. sativus TaxID=79200 RepID=A0AAF0W2W8_DAUCS|nr:hypothetical protein DCAR_0100276 [Daucus carota subsp. sativus]